MNKTLILLALIAASASLSKAQACQLDETDLAAIDNSMAPSGSKYTRASLPKPGSADFTSMCQTRALVKKVKAARDGGNYETLPFQLPKAELPARMSPFMTAEEYSGSGGQNVSDTLLTVAALGYPAPSPNRKRA